MRVGVIGLGWAGQQHLEAYSSIPDVTVVALAGKERELGETLSAEYRVPALFDNWEDLLATPGLDAVSVAVPTFLHAPIAIAALHHGIHVLSEKPIARNGDEAAAMVSAARSAGRILDVAFNHRRRGDIRALREIIGRGELGEVYHARATWMRRRGIPKLGSWFTNREMAGGGVLTDIGVHVIDWALYLLGEPTVVSVSAASYAALGPRGLGGADRDTADESVSAFEVEDFVSAFIRLSTGATVALETSWAAFRAPDDLMDFTAFGMEGGAELTIPGATLAPIGQLRVFRDAAGEPSDYSPVISAGTDHQGVVDDFVAIVRDPSSWAGNDGSTALARARVIDACYRSAAEGREVFLAEG